MMEKPKASNHRPLPRYAHLVLVGVALGISYAALSRAIDSGSWLDYAATLLLFGLAIRHLVLAFGRREA
jgi:hypothetical protein